MPSSDEAATMHAPASDTIDTNKSPRAGHPGLLNSLLGTVGVLVALAILVREGMEPDANRGGSARPSGLAVFRWAQGPVFTLAWSLDGSQLAASGFSPLIRVWNIESGNARSLENRDEKPHFVLGWSGDGHQLIVGGLEVPVESRDLASEPGDKSEVLVQPEDRSSFAKVMAASSRGRSTRLWGPSDGRMRLLPDACNSAHAVAFSTDGRFMASGENFGALRIWDLGSREIRRTHPTDPRGVNSVAFSLDSSKVASAGGGPIRVWDVASGREIATLGEVCSGSAAVAFTPDGRRIAGATWDGSIRVWDLSTRREQTRLEGHLGHVLVLAWSPDGKTLASGGYDSTVRLWDVAESVAVARAD